MYATKYFWINYLTKFDLQLSFERRVSVSQLVIMITLFVFMALSRGTFSTLSPVMAAQQVERKRRESIDQSSAIVINSIDNTSNNTIKSMNADDVKLANTATQKTSETPKKPNNPRRHTDNLYHIINDREINIPSAPRSRGLSNAATTNDTQPSNRLSRNASFEKLGIDLQNEVLQKKLGDIYLQQQEEQQVPLLSGSASRKPSFDNLADSTIKNRKRSSTSPSAIE
jgi:hypothetical protein